MARIRTLNHPLVGKVRWKPADDGSRRIFFPDHWDSQHIASVYVQELDGIETYGDISFSGHVLFHEDYLSQLEAAFRAVWEEGLLDRILFWGGSFNPRLMTGRSDKISMHALGLAFDINPQYNVFGKPPVPKGHKGSVVELVPVLKRFGFSWGGSWRNPDGMHFEVERKLEA